MCVTGTPKERRWMMASAAERPEPTTRYGFVNDVVEVGYTRSIDLGTEEAKAVACWESGLFLATMSLRSCDTKSASSPSISPNHLGFSKTPVARTTAIVRIAKGIFPLPPSSRQ